MVIHIRIITSLCLILLFLWQPALALDGKQLYATKFCITCHGEKGIAEVPNYPSLAGQNPRYMTAQVNDILSGKRKSDLTILMTDNPIVAGITEEELAAIIDYLAGL